MAQRTSQGVMDGGGALPSGTAQPALPRGEALGRCNPDQRAPSPALAKEDVLYATRPKPPAQLIRATRSRVGPNYAIGAISAGRAAATPSPSSRVGAGRRGLPRDDEAHAPDPLHRRPRYRIQPASTRWSD